MEIQTHIMDRSRSILTNIKKTLSLDMGDWESSITKHVLYTTDKVMIDFIICGKNITIIIADSYGLHVCRHNRNAVNTIGDVVKWIDRGLDPLNIMRVESSFMYSCGVETAFRNAYNNIKFKFGGYD